MRCALLGLLALVSLTYVAADCPNACSGHGDCITNNDYCSCYNGWMANDCSQQICPYGLSFIDTPFGDIDGDNALKSGGFDTTRDPFGSPNPVNPMFRKYGWWERHPAQLYGAGAAPGGTPAGDAIATFPFGVKYNEGHFYAECSNRGICDRTSGLCTCFTGYEGAACNRTVCVNDCSGHGICQTINDMTPENKHYRLWDADKTRVCKCDGGYFGVDCSQRKCWKNDDPLTTKTSNTFYSADITETSEIQYVDIRCPYNGMILGPAYVTLTYTDVQFGDKYETPMFDILTATGSDIEDLLVALPNEVLATYDDGSANGVKKVTAVTITQIDDSNSNPTQYRIAVTFASALGNVPLLSGTPYFKCQGGAEVLSDTENVKVDYIGDGPAYDIVFKLTASSGGTAFTVNDITNSTGDSLRVTAGTVSFTAASGATAITFDEFGREPQKVQFTFGKGDGTNGAGGALDRANGETVTITIHTTPVITATNKIFTLAANGGALRSMTAITGSGTPVRIVDSGYTSGATDIDFVVRAVIVDGTNGIVRVYVNGEIFGLVTVTSTADQVKDLVLDQTSGDLASFEFVLGTKIGGYLTVATLQIASAGTNGNVFESYFPKTPNAFYSGKVSTGGDDEITVTFANGRAPRGPIALVIQITKINTSADEFRWKVAGDAAWSDVNYALTTSGGSVTTTAGTSTAIPAANTPTALPNYNSFAIAYPDDPVRLDVRYLLLSWAGGPDNQKRLCNSAAATYYIQIGSEGLNDAPECSDRGVCDYSSGICKCFKGYAGIDCTTQNALSTGASAA